MMTNKNNPARFEAGVEAGLRLAGISRERVEKLEYSSMDFNNKIRQCAIAYDEIEDAEEAKRRMHDVIDAQNIKL